MVIFVKNSLKSHNFMGLKQLNLLIDKGSKPSQGDQLLLCSSSIFKKQLAHPKMSYHEFL